MKQQLPKIATVLLIAGALVLLTQRERWSGMKWAEQSAATPEDVLWRMSDAAREGNVPAYLDCFSGSLRQHLQKTMAEMGEAQFSEYLKKLNDEVTGIAVSDLKPVDAQEATLKVEFVFRGKTEAQQHHFRLVEGKWKIDGVETAERVKVLIPYGTAVTDKE